MSDIEIECLEDSDTEVVYCGEILHTPNINSRASELLPSGQTEQKTEEDSERRPPKRGRSQDNTHQTFWTTVVKFNGEGDWHDFEQTELSNMKNRTSIKFKVKVIYPYYKDDGTWEMFVRFSGIGRMRQSFEEKLRTYFTNTRLKCTITTSEDIPSSFEDDDGSWGLHIMCIGVGNREMFQQAVQKTARDAKVHCKIATVTRNQKQLTSEHSNRTAIVTPVEMQQSQHINRTSNPSSNSFNQNVTPCENQVTNQHSNSTSTNTFNQNITPVEKHQSQHINRTPNSSSNNVNQNVTPAEKQLTSQHSNSTPRTSPNTLNEVTTVQKLRKHLFTLKTSRSSSKSLNQDITPGERQLTSQHSNNTSGSLSNPLRQDVTPVQRQHSQYLNCSPETLPNIVNQGHDITITPIDKLLAQQYCNTSWSSSLNTLNHVRPVETSQYSDSAFMRSTSNVPNRNEITGSSSMTISDSMYIGNQTPVMNSTVRFPINNQPSNNTASISNKADETHASNTSRQPANRMGENRSGRSCGNEFSDSTNICASATTQPQDACSAGSSGINLTNTIILATSSNSTRNYNSGGKKKNRRRTDINLGSISEYEVHGYYCNQKHNSSFGTKIKKIREFLKMGEKIGPFTERAELLHYLSDLRAANLYVSQVNNLQVGRHTKAAYLTYIKQFVEHVESKMKDSAFKPKLKTAIKFWGAVCTYSRTITRE